MLVYLSVTLDLRGNPLRQKFTCRSSSISICLQLQSPDQTYLEVKLTLQFLSSRKLAENPSPLLTASISKVFPWKEPRSYCLHSSTCIYSHCHRMHLHQLIRFVQVWLQWQHCVLTMPTGEVIDLVARDCLLIPEAVKKENAISTLCWCWWRRHNTLIRRMMNRYWPTWVDCSRISRLSLDFFSLNAFGIKNISVLQQTCFIYNTLSKYLGNERCFVLTE